ADWTRIADRYFLFSLIWLASVTAIAFRIWYALVRTYKMTSVAVYSFLISVWGTMLSVVFLGERFIWPLAAGLVLVVCGIILMNTERGSHIRELPPESTP
ncbi:MAG: EamA family transporter, partial [Candidatus Sumerlaeota bacterium]|nr:EamA family transporter [Candidatus Sumerlaeota bacterium]